MLIRHFNNVDKGCSIERGMCLASTAFTIAVITDAGQEQNRAVFSTESAQGDWCFYCCHQQLHMSNWPVSVAVAAAQQQQLVLLH